MSGTIKADGESFELSPKDSFAVLDRGRGKWPDAMSWNWAYQAFGVWSGTALDDEGVRHSLDGLTGWVEQARNRW